MSEDSDASAVLLSKLPSKSITTRKLEKDPGEKYVDRFIAEKLGDQEETTNIYVNIAKTARKKLRTPREPQNLMKKRVLSSTKKKELKLFQIPPEQLKYSMYEPLHQLWLAYMRDCLNIQPGRKPFIDHMLLKCDLHGCLIRVTKSTCPSYVGTYGILVQETKNTFKIITKDDRLKVVPKVNCEFTFVVDDLVVTIHGKHFRYKPSDRAMKSKIKERNTVDM